MQKSWIRHWTPARRRRKPADIDAERNYVTVTHVGPILLYRPDETVDGRRIEQTIEQLHVLVRVEKLTQHVRLFAHTHTEKRRIRQMDFFKSK